MGSFLVGHWLAPTSFPGVPLVGHPAFSMAAGVSIILFWTIGPDTRTYALVSGLIRRTTHVCRCVPGLSSVDSIRAQPDAFASLQITGSDNYNPLIRDLSLWYHAWQPNSSAGGGRHWDHQRAAAGTAAVVRRSTLLLRTRSHLPNFMWPRFEGASCLHRGLCVCLCFCVVVCVLSSGCLVCRPFDLCVCAVWAPLRRVNKYNSWSTARAQRSGVSVLCRSTVAAVSATFAHAVAL